MWGPYEHVYCSLCHYHELWRSWSTDGSPEEAVIFRYSQNEAGTRLITLCPECGTKLSGWLLDESDYRAYTRAMTTIARVVFHHEDAE